MERLSVIMITCSRRLWRRGEWLWDGRFASGEDAFIRMREEVSRVCGYNYEKHARSCVASGYTHTCIHMCKI